MKRLLGVVVVLALAGCPKQGAEPQGSGAQLPDSAVKQIEALLKEKDLRTPAQRKLSSQLLYARNGMPAGIEWKTSDQVQSTAQVDAKQRHLVDIRGGLTDGVLAQVRALGGDVVNVVASRVEARAWMPLATLETLAADPAVKSIRPAAQAKTARTDPPRGLAKVQLATRAERVAALQRAIAQTAPRLGPAPVVAEPNAGSVTSEGSKAHAVDRARKWFATNGAGVKIGVLSDSDDWKENSIASGDLPADTVTIPGQDGRPGSGEGTAMMEIIHDVAPGAQIFFATAFNGPESFAENIRTLRYTYHCDIILDDIIYYFEAPFQDDIIAQAVNDVTADGALYLSSAGNQGNENDGTSGVWEGDFWSAGTLATLPSGYTVHDFGEGAISNRVELRGGPLTLSWADPGALDNPQSCNDYDLFVLDYDLRNVAVASTDIQDCTGWPQEFLGYYIPANYRVVIAKKAGAARRALHLALWDGELGLSTDGSTVGHNSAAGGIGAAAVDIFEAGGGEFTAGPTTPVELYSADGPRWIFYKADGTPARSGSPLFSGSGGEFRQKPDLAGADGVVTTLPSFSGLNPFFGTSAAAPHLGAIAALLKSAVPSANGKKLKTALQAGALDIEAAGWDRDTGAGIASAFKALQAMGATPAAFLELAGTTLTPAGGATAFLPGGGGTLAASLVNNGGARASGVRGTLSSSSPYVTVTAPSATFGNIASGATAASSAPFAFTLSPSTPCGSKVDLTLTITYTGRGPNPVVVHIPVQTGRASTTPIHVTYGGAPVPIPDDDLAGVDIPLAVTGVGSVSKVVFNIDGSTCSTAVGATTVGIDHSWTGDMTATLTSPGGTRVTLFAQPGGALNSGNNFCQTKLDDAATTSIQSISSSGAPWTGTFAPASPLAAFVGASADGTWVLNINDAAFLDTGTVRAFSLDLSSFTCAP